MMKAEFMSDDLIVKGARGCERHRQFQSPSGTWRGFTKQEMIVIRAIFAYCKLSFAIENLECPSCKREALCNSPLGTI